MGKNVKMVVHNGIRYRPEDAARLGLDQETEVEQKPAKKPAKRPRAPRAAKAETKVVEPSTTGDVTS